jgi:hypothetical protein
MKTNIVIGFYPNAKGFGYAIFRNATNPILCGMVTVSPMSNKESLVKMEKLIQHFNPSTIVIQKIGNKYSYKSKRVSLLLNKLSFIYTQQKTQVSSYSRIEIKEVFSNFNAQTKFEIAHVIARWLPQYKNKLPHYRKAWMAESYNQGMFDAMSLVLTFYYLEK